MPNKIVWNLIAQRDERGYYAEGQLYDGRPVTLRMKGPNWSDMELSFEGPPVRSFNHADLGQGQIIAWRAVRQGTAS